MKLKLTKIFLIFGLALTIVSFNTTKVNAANCPPNAEVWRDPRCNPTREDYQTVYNMGKYVIRCTGGIFGARKGNLWGLAACLP